LVSTGALAGRRDKLADRAGIVAERGNLVCRLCNRSHVLVVPFVGEHLSMALDDVDFVSQIVSEDAIEYRQPLLA
jgi:hypothetical protein